MAGDIAAIRYLNNGALDASFGTIGIARLTSRTTTEAGWKMAQQPDGKVIIAGQSVETPGFHVVRFGANGVWTQLLEHPGSEQYRLVQMTFQKD